MVFLNALPISFVIFFLFSCLLLRLPFLVIFFPFDNIGKVKMVHFLAETKVLYCSKPDLTKLAMAQNENKNDGMHCFGGKQGCYNDDQLLTASGFRVVNLKKKGKGALVKFADVNRAP